MSGERLTAMLELILPQVIDLIIRDIYAAAWQ